MTIDLLGTELPVIQAPMAGVQGSALAIAVSEAGGLGSLPAAMLSLDALAAELTAIRAATDRPYNVNFFCHTPPVRDSGREEAWRAALLPYYREYGIAADQILDAPARRPFDLAVADVVAPFRPPVVSFHFGLPSPELVDIVKGWGSVVLSSATTVDEAVWLEQHGADGVIAQGVEAGGHRGMFLGDDLATQLPTADLVQRIVASVQVPVIAAGGIADRTDVVQALALGATAVQVGTAYLLCPEATTSAVHRAALMSATASDTELTTLFTGRPARSIVNRLMRELGPLHPTPAFPLAGGALAPLRAAAERQGSSDFSPLWCGGTPPARQVDAATLTRLLSGAG